jgi:NTE family protein
LPVNLYSHNTQLAEYRFSQVDGGFDVGYMFDRFSELRAGYDIGWQSYSLDIGNPNALPQVSGRQGVTRTRYVVDRLNEAVIPTQGLAVASEFDFYDSRPGAADKVPVLQGTTQFFQPIRRDDSLYLTASGGSTFGFTKTGVPLFTLGGPFRLSAYGTNEIFTNQYAFLQAGYLRRVGTMPSFFGRRVYFSALYEIAKPSDTRGGISDLPMDGAVGIVAETLIGPAYIGGSWGDSGHRKIFFALGHIF